MTALTAAQTKALRVMSETDIDFVLTGFVRVDSHEFVARYSTVRVLLLKGYARHIPWGRYAITPAGRAALAKEIPDAQ